ncbi:MAG: hypothetical protein S4CHLAM102_10850 [Chlamydiia bacterium]|nr:hypothetical protein [Chlamydiia bacterium]
MKKNTKLYKSVLIGSVCIGIISLGLFGYYTHLSNDLSEQDEKTIVEIASTTFYERFQASLQVLRNTQQHAHDLAMNNRDITEKQLSLLLKKTKEKMPGIIGMGLIDRDRLYLCERENKKELCEEKELGRIVDIIREQQEARKSAEVFIPPQREVATRVYVVPLSNYVDEEKPYFNGSGKYMLFFISPEIFQPEINSQYVGAKEHAYIMDFSKKPLIKPEATGEVDIPGHANFTMDTFSKNGTRTKFGYFFDWKESRLFLLKPLGHSYWVYYGCFSVDKLAYEIPEKQHLSAMQSTFLSIFIMCALIAFLLIFRKWFFIVLAALIGGTLLFVLLFFAWVYFTPHHKDDKERHSITVEINNGMDELRLRDGINQLKDKLNTLNQSYEENIKDIKALTKERELIEQKYTDAKKEYDEAEMLWKQRCRELQELVSGRVETASSTQFKEKVQKATVAEEMANYKRTHYRKEMLQEEKLLRDLNRKEESIRKTGISTQIEIEKAKAELNWKLELLSPSKEVVVPKKVSKWKRYLKRN